MESNSDCYSCGIPETTEEDETCPKSKMACEHHCNHSWTHDICCWCGKEWKEED